MTLTYPTFSLSVLFGVLRQKSDGTLTQMIQKPSVIDAAMAERAVLHDIMEHHPDAFCSEFGLVEMMVRYRCEG